MDQEHAETQNLVVEKSSDPVYTPAQIYKISAVYDFIAKLLPTEGRDYKLKFSFGTPENPDRFGLEIIPYTHIGKIWRDYCLQMLKQANKK